MYIIYLKKDFININKTYFSLNRKKFESPQIADRWRFKLFKTASKTYSCELPIKRNTCASAMPFNRKWLDFHKYF